MSKYLAIFAFLLVASPVFAQSTDVSETTIAIDRPEFFGETVVIVDNGGEISSGDESVVDVTYPGFTGENVVIVSNEGDVSTGDESVSENVDVQPVNGHETGTDYTNSGAEAPVSEGDVITVADPSYQGPIVPISSGSESETEVAVIIPEANDPTPQNGHATGVEYTDMGTEAPEAPVVIDNAADNDTSDVVVNKNGNKKSGSKKKNPLSSLQIGGTVEGATAFMFNMNLGRHTQHNDVVELQARLRTLGYFTYPTNTGYFGPFTQAAVEAYQKDKGIITTGFVGPLTRAALNSQI